MEKHVGGKQTNCTLVGRLCGDFLLFCFVFLLLLLTEGKTYSKAPVRTSLAFNCLQNILSDFKRDNLFSVLFGCGRKVGTLATAAKYLLL